MKAKFVKKLVEGFTGDARLYQLKRSNHKHRYVVVSAITVPFSGPETYIFPANKYGVVKDWLELDGSFQGAMDHERALRGMGCTSIEGG